MDKSGYQRINNQLHYYKSLNSKRAIHPDYWQGADYINTFFYNYLLAKYKNGCNIFDDGNVKNAGLNYQYDEKFNIQKYRHMDIVDTISKCINEDTTLLRNNELLVIPLTIIYYNPTEYHSNVLIYRKSTNTFEHFEPHFGEANILNDEEEINNSLHDFILAFIDSVNEQTTIQKSKLIFRNGILKDSYNPGLQSLQRDFYKHATIEDKNARLVGFCQAWTFLFTEMVLSNPKYTSNEIFFAIMKEARKKGDGEFLHNLILGYMKRVNDKIKRYYSFIFNMDATIENISKLKNDDLTSLRYSLHFLIAYDKIRMASSENNLEVNTKTFIKKSTNLINDQKFRNFLIEVKLFGLLERLPHFKSETSPIQSFSSASSEEENSQSTTRKRKRSNSSTT